MLVQNPDKLQIYHIWHFCNDCQKPFTHSQADCNLHKGHQYLSIDGKLKEYDFPTCPNCGAVLSMPHPQDQKAGIHSICWKCGNAYYDPSDEFDRE